MDEQAADAVVSLRMGDGSEASVPLRQLRARQVVAAVPWRKTRSARRQAYYPGYYWSATMGAHVIYEIRLELARLLLADFDRDVVAIAAQPFLLQAHAGGRARRHVPDFLLVHADQSVRVVNVKPASRLAEPQIAEALAWPASLFEAHGWQHEIWSGADPVLLSNLRFLAGYRRPGLLSEGLLDDVRAAVRPGDTIGAVIGQDPADHGFHVLRWEHADAIGGPFSGEALAYARQLAAATHRFPDTRRALAGLLEQWGAGLAGNRAERRMALRLSEQRLRLVPDLPPAATPVPASVAEAGGGDDSDGELDAPFPGEVPGDDPGDFYADAMETV